MGFLGFLQGSPLKKFQKDAEENPSPETVGNLARKLIELGQLEEALLVAERGLQTFKDATALRDIVSFIKKKRSQDRVKRLRDELKVKPSPTAYTQLADIYRELGDIDQALELLGECAERFADDELAYRMIGQIRLENFLHEVIAYDGLHALQALRKVKSINPSSTTARMLLAQLYYAVGANALCVKELREEVDANATALDIKEFLDDLGSPAELPQDVTVESLVERAEETGALPNSLQGFPRVKPGVAQRTSAPPKINPVAAARLVEEMAGIAGLRNVMALDREGKVVANLDGEEPLPRESFHALVEGITRAASDACRRMDIGSFVKGGAHFPGGGAVLQRRRGMTFAILFRDPVKHDRAASLLGDLVNKTLGTGGTRA